MKTKTILISIVALAVIGIAVMQFAPKQTPPAQEKINTQVQASPTTEVMAEETAYKDGEYTAKGSYVSPAGPEEIEVTVTLKDDVIVGSEFKGLGTNKTTVRMQGLFAEGYKELVIGKNIDEVTLDVVNGSSLTPKGFQDALEKIQKQAS